MVMLGIDLGTTNSLAVAFLDGQVTLIPNTFGEYLTPSVVHISDEGVLVGQLAKERLVTFPGQTVQLFKRSMGSREKFQLGEKLYRPSELSALVVKQLIADAETFLGEKVEEVVISVPAYFNEYQRQATKKIGRLLGVTVERLVNEPSAAAIACHGFDQDETFIVFDFGGGTLDVSVVDCFDNMVSICAIAGDNQLGGSDFDQALVDYFCEIHAINFEKEDARIRSSLLLAAERCKLTLQEEEVSYLSLNLDGETLGLKVTRALYRQLIEPILAKVKAVIARAVRESNLDVSEIDAFVLVGGSSKMPLVQEFLQEVMNLPIKQPDGMDQLVAQGLGTYLGIKGRQEPVRSIVVTDVCPFSLGVESFSEELQMDHVSKIIQKNQVLPTTAHGYYSTRYLGQDKIRFSLYQGESLNPASNLFLGEVTIPVPVNKGEHEGVKVTFSYDLNALLYVEITVLSTQVTHRYRLDKGRLVEVVGESVALDTIKSLSLALSQEPYYASLMEKAYRIHAELPLSYQVKLEEIISHFVKHYEQKGVSLKQKKEMLAVFDGQLVQCERLLQGLGVGIFREEPDDEE